MRSYSSKEKKIILKFRQSGAFLKEFVKSYDISDATLQNWCKKYYEFGIDELGSPTVTADKEEKEYLKKENDNLRRKILELETRDEMRKKIEVLINKKSS